MSLLSIFTELNKGRWTTAGLDVQYKVVNDMLHFQCSNGASDWRYNFMASEDVYKNSDIEFIGHKGFNEIWESVRHDIEKLSFRKIGGYSQGGALAVRAHENYFHRFGYEPDVTITFGCPPSIKNPSRELSARFSHVVNWHNPRDLVYYTPMILGYEHVGSSRELKNIAVKPKDVSLPIWLSGHDPTRYMQNLKYL